MNAVDTKQFHLPGYISTLLHAEDQARIQVFLEKCADYSLLVTGSTPNPSAAGTMLADCPPGKTLADKYVIGICTGNQNLIGVLDAVRAYPTQDDWWLGLLLLDPASRGKGLGRYIYQSFESWVAKQGAKRIFLGVLEENQKAYNFWQMMGFLLLEKQAPKSFGNLFHVVFTMVHNLSDE